MARLPRACARTQTRPKETPMADPTPRAYTENEVREMVQAHIRGLVTYWASEGGSNVSVHETRRARLEGLAFSIMVMLDGGSALPGFSVMPNPSPDDQAFNKSRGEHWFPDDIDIAGSLHETLFHVGDDS